MSNKTYSLLDSKLNFTYDITINIERFIYIYASDFYWILIWNHTNPQTQNNTH